MTRLTFKSLAKSVRAKPDKIPRGWLTTKQIADREGVDVTMVQRTIKTSRERGAKIPSKKFRLVRADGQTHPVTHYKL